MKFITLKITVLYSIIFLFLVACGAPKPNKKSKVYEEQPKEIQVQRQLNFLIKQEKNGSKDPDVYFYLSELHFDQGQNVEALKYFKQSITFDSVRKNYIHLGIKIYNRLGQYKEAIALGKRLEISEDLASNILIDLAWSYSMVGMERESQKCVGLAVIKTPKTEFLTGYNFLLMGDTINGTNKLNKLYNASANIPEIYTTLADIYYLKGKYGKLRSVIKKVENLNYSDTLIWEHAANYQLVLDNKDGANKIYKSILKLDPSHYRANKLLAMHYYELGIHTPSYTLRKNLDTSLIYMNRILDVASKEDFRMMGNAYKKLRRYDESLEYYKKVMEIAPSDSLAQEEIEDVVKRINYLAKLKLQPIDTTIQND